MAEPPAVLAADPLKDELQPVGARWAHRELIRTPVAAERSAVELARPELPPPKLKKDLHSMVADLGSQCDSAAVGVFAVRAMSFVWWIELLRGVRAFPAREHNGLGAQAVRELDVSPREAAAVVQREVCPAPTEKPLARQGPGALE